MVLYIEFIIIDNIIMNYILFWLIERTLKIKLTKFRKMLSCGLGVMFSLFLPFVFKLKVIFIMYKLTSMIIVVFILKKYKTLKNYIVFLIVYGTYTCVLGGVIWGIINLFSIKYNYNGLIIYNFEFPVSLIFVIFLLMVWLFKAMILELKRQLKISNYLYNIKLVDGENEACGVGFLDSGNNIEVDGGVNIISLNMFLKLHKEISIDKFLLKKVPNNYLKDLKYITITGLAGGEKYLSFVVDKMFIENTMVENVRVAVALKNFEKFDCVLHKSFVGGVL